jgi:putative CocE/NonD family hydrolase
LAEGQFAVPWNFLSKPNLSADGYDFVEWAAAQPWSNKKVAFSGNSYLAISQWFIAAEQPPHLAAIAPWEGFYDSYREASRRGGIAQPGFGEEILQTFAGRAYVEDLNRMQIDDDLMSPYWVSTCTMTWIE